nr:DNA-binding response regulator [Ottowia sp.]MBP8895259.1 DNA-binding response regulator [Ottowia sp.]
MAIYVIDDHPLMREAVVMLLRRVRPGSDVVELSQLSDLDRAVATKGAPELFCLDLKLPDTVG